MKWLIVVVMVCAHGAGLSAEKIKLGLDLKAAPVLPFKWIRRDQGAD